MVEEESNEEYNKILKEIEETKQYIKDIENRAKAEKFQREANNNAILKKNDKMVVSGGWHNFLVGSFIFFIAFSLIFLLLIYNGKFRSIINQGDINIQPLVNPITNNNYSFNSSSETRNEYKIDNNFTIVNQINCNSS